MSKKKYLLIFGYFKRYFWVFKDAFLFFRDTFRQLDAFLIILLAYVNFIQKIVG